MRRRLAAASLALVALAAGQSVTEEGLRKAIESHLGRPYVWGADGLKSFDCSGFVWRVAHESGYYFKRTTARKLFFSTRPAKPGERGRFGNLIFFDSLKHVGIVNDRSSFYHAQTSLGTNLSTLTPHWRGLVAGEHKLLLDPQ
jgi:cell wall-associated NlpC family hydrolase